MLTAQHQLYIISYIIIVNNAIILSNIKILKLSYFSFGQQRASRQLSSKVRTCRAGGTAVTSGLAWRPMIVRESREHLPAASLHHLRCSQSGQQQQGRQYFSSIKLRNGNHSSNQAIVLNGTISRDPVLHSIGLERI